MISRSTAILNKNIKLYNSYPEEIKSLRNEIQQQIKNLLGIISSQNLVVTGHQVEFFHPGIISKEILGSTLASQLKGTCLSIVLDHDPHDLIFQCPQILNKESIDRIRKVSFLLNTKSEAQDALHHKKAWVHFLRQVPGSLNNHIVEPVMEQIQENINHLIDHSDKYHAVSDYITSSRLEILKKASLNVISLKVSDMVKIAGWNLYCDLINNNLDHFIEAHNASLMEYRKLHHIKNHAQPVSNLHPGEIPFWIFDITQGRIKASPNDLGKKTLYPRAITLSIFLRLFASDIFIHGAGGARYDQVTNSIIRKFFNVIPSTFLVKTANLQLPLKPESPLLKFKNIQTIQDWFIRYRYFLFHPDKMEGADPELVKLRQQLLKKFKESKGSRKSIHDDLEANRLQILNQQDSYENLLLKERDEIKKYAQDRNILFDRTLPYFFYDLNEIIQDENYGIVEYN